MAMQRSDDPAASQPQPVVLPTPVFDAIREQPNGSGVKAARALIPAEIRDVPLWGFLLTTQKPGDEKVHKRPFPIGYKSNDDSGESAIAALTAFGRCVKAGTHDNLVLSFKLRRGSLGEGKHVVGYDFDHCRNPETGEITDKRVAQFVAMFEGDVYCEVSPSGTGLHVIGWRPEPPTWDGSGPYKRGTVERYCHDRLFSFTGDAVGKMPKTLRLPEQFDAVFEQMFELDKAPHLVRDEPARAVADPRGAFARAERAGTLPEVDPNVATMFDDAKPVPEEIEHLLLDYLVEDSADAQRMQDFKAGKFVRSDGEVIWTESSAKWSKGREPAGNTIDSSVVDMQAAATVAKWSDDPDQILRFLRRLGLERDKWESDRSGASWIERIVESALDVTGNRQNPWKQTAFLYRVVLHAIELAKGAGNADHVVDIADHLFELRCKSADLFTKLRARIKSEKVMPMGAIDGLMKDREQKHKAQQAKQVRQSVEAPAAESGSDDQLLIVDVGGTQKASLEQFKAAIVSLAEDKNEVVRLPDGEMARVVVDEDEQCFLDPLNPTSMSLLLVENVQCVKRSINMQTGEVTEKNVNLPDCFPGLLVAARGLHLPKADLVSEVPVVDLNTGDVIEHGIDPQSNTYVSVPEGFLATYREHAIENPTLEDAKAALAFVEREVFIDFPLVSDADRANLIATLLTVALACVWGEHSIPIIIIFAPTAGSGKTLMAKLIVWPIRRAAEPCAVSKKATEGEFDKAVVAEMRLGSAALILDNLSGDLESDVLAAVATGGRYAKTRILGQSKAIRLRANRPLVCTGNNLNLDIDLARRTLPVNIDPQTDNPHLRTGFHRDESEMIEWAISNRPQILAALHTIIRGWIAAGRPTEGAPTVGSFAYWARTIGGMLAWLGVEGLLSNRDVLMTSSAKKSKLLQVLILLRTAFQDEPFVVRDIYGSGNHNLTSELSEWFDLESQKDKDALGKFLRQSKNNRVNFANVTYWLETDGTDRRGSALWRVRSEKEVT